NVIASPKGVAIPPRLLHFKVHAENWGKEPPNGSVALYGRRRRGQAPTLHQRNISQPISSL
ncbi:MAG: hypothetical protein LRZ90_01525, partial [Thermodesulfovibrionales bacterium]|nr:hypothetical protein [Thermodesulfovibrionales bacterium]